MKTNITFEVLKDREVIQCIVPIEHNFYPIKGCTFLGYDFPPRSVEDQVIEYLDSIDKSSLMVEYGFDIIFDYWPTPVEEDEFTSFIEYISPYVTPELAIPVEAIIHEAKDILFGQGKSHLTKANEVFTMLRICNKTIGGTLNVIQKLINGQTKYESGQDCFGFIGSNH